MRGTMARWPGGAGVGCVSLEVTQRCNLDCELCYLSEHSEAIGDIPLEEVFRRIDMTRDEYGSGTSIQVSGGEPTLRRRDEFVAIVRRIAALGMRSVLFTNGILATRELLEMLADAGLSDVAFHVDMTQQRRGYDSEDALNELRLRYIERARGLPLAVFFNTTVFEGNHDDVPSIVRFFAAHADVVRVASFQLQADTGRGVLRERPEAVSQASVIAAIEKDAGTTLDFDAISTGHPCCIASPLRGSWPGRYTTRSRIGTSSVASCSERLECMFPGIPRRLERRRSSLPRWSGPTFGLAGWPGSRQPLGGFEEAWSAPADESESCRSSCTTSWTPRLSTPSAWTHAFSWRQPRSDLYKCAPTTHAGTSFS